MESLTSGWARMRERTRAAGALAIFLDYDGTLAPIARHPSKALLPVSTRHLLEELSREKNIWVSVVSGRALREVRRMVGLNRICYVGNHGLEVQGPKLRHINPKAQRSRPVLSRIALQLREILRPIREAWVEDKGLTLSVHSRGVAPPDRLLVRNAFYEVVRPYQEKGQVRVTAGKEVFEVRPPVRWTKGTVVSWLLARRMALTGPKPVLPVYIGDDLTDEDAFQALGKRGITVVVGSSNPLSRAQYRAEAPAEVTLLLKQILREWRGKRSVSERGADRAGRGDERRARRHVARRA